MPFKMFTHSVYENCPSITKIIWAKSFIPTLKIYWRTHVKRQQLSYRLKLRVVSPSISLDSKEIGTMAAVVRLS
jgi:hypothetical protein